MSIKCVQNKTATVFLERNEEQLLKNESMNNLILGLANSIVRNLRRSDKPFFFTLLNNEEIIGQAIRTNSEKPVAISGMDRKALEILAATLNNSNITLAGVVGPKNSSLDFSNIWCGLNKIESEIEMHQGIYEIT